MSLFSVVHYDADGELHVAGSSTERREAEGMLAIVAKHAPDGYWQIEERPDGSAGYALALALADASLEHRRADRALAAEAQRRKVGKLTAAEGAEQERLIGDLTMAMLTERAALDAWEQYRTEHPKPKGDHHE